MPEKMHWVKMGCIQRDRRLADLADALNLRYEYLLKITGGFMCPPDGFARRVNEVFKTWDSAGGVVPLPESAMRAMRGTMRPIG